MNELYEWWELTQQLKITKARELELRKKLFAEHFPEPAEGVNRCEISGNSELVATYPYRYTLDEVSVDAGLEHVPESKREKLITWKMGFSKAIYNKLSKKAREAFTAECITVTPGTPSLKIVSKDDG